MKTKTHSYKPGFIIHLGKVRAVIREFGRCVWIEPDVSESRLEAAAKERAKIEELQAHQEIV